MTTPPPAGDPWVDPRIPAPRVPEPSAAPTPEKDGRRGPVLALAITCAVLLLTTIGFGGAAAWLWFDRSVAAAPESTPTPTPTAKSDAAEPQLVQGIEVTVVSDLEFGAFAMSKLVPDDYVSLYSSVTNPDSDQAAEVFFDITAYAEDGSILDRSPESVYILPGQTTMFEGLFGTDITDATRLVVEQTTGEFTDPVMTGEVVVDDVRGGEGYVEVTATSTLSQVPEYAAIFIFGSLDGGIFGVCSTYPDVPAGGSFMAGCELEPVSADSPKTYSDFPKGAEFGAFIALDIPW